MDMMNLLPLLNSPDIATVRQIKEVVIEQLNNSKWLDVLILNRQQMTEQLIRSLLIIHIFYVTFPFNSISTVPGPD